MITQDYTLEYDPRRFITVPVPIYSSRIAIRFSERIADAIISRDKERLVSLLDKKPYLKNYKIFEKGVDVMHSRKTMGLCKIKDEIYIRICMYRGKKLYKEEAEPILQSLEETLKWLEV